MKCPNCNSIMCLNKEEVPVAYTHFFCTKCPLAIHRTEQDRYGKER